ncbi:hypothetical protein ACNKHK_02465 [Shigella flexneri]
MELGGETTTSLRSSTVNRHPVWVSSWRQVLTPQHRKRYPRRTEEVSRSALRSEIVYPYTPRHTLKCLFAK